MTPIPFIKTLSRHEKASKKYQPAVNQINLLTDEFKKMSDKQLKQTVIKHQGKSLAELRQNVPELFAAIREASERILKLRHFDVQLLGGMALLDNQICEMKTGEGKTLVATLPLILHGLTGQGAHLVTVNDYLSSRDAEWMRPLFEFFGLSVGVVASGMTPPEKREAYAADITYGTNNEFGFDYLRDNMATSPENMVQRKLDFAIVDEVDSILIDEARTPLIISAPDAESTKLYEQFASMVPQLKENIHYNIDEKRKAASLTDEGVEKIENMLGIDNLYAEGGLRQVHHIEQALRAQTLFQKDKEYVVQNGQVIIVDEFTGRLMAGRRYSEGLHQAIEAKEGVDVQQESRTLATITFQNFFRLYENLAGMTGTAVTSAEEFEKVYNLDVVVIPTNQALVRNDKTDRIYVNEKAKFRAVVEEIKLRQTKGQPVLVGTIAIEKSEYLSKMLSTAGVKHEVLNAKHHAREAEIISQSGQHGSVTISTNMAGRGTDIKLGEGVIALGGLFVLGTERHEARRIDNQLRGRSGRQGDPGETQFFVSMEDDIMRIFGGDRLKRIMERLKVPEDQPIENKMVSRSLEGAQERVEGHYFDMRKQVLSYDDVLNKQRDAIYTLRRSIMLKNIWKESGQQEDLKAHINQLIKEQADAIVFAHTQLGEPETWNIEEIGESIHAVTNIPLNQLRSSLDSARNQARANGPDTARKKLSDLAKELMTKQLKARQQELGEEIFKKLAQAASLRAIDTHWMDHLDTMDYLRTGIGLRGYGQRDPLVEYQREGYQLFQQLLSTIKSAIVEVIYKAQAVRQETNQGEAHHQSATSPHRIAESIAGEAPNHKPAQHSSVLDAISKDNINSQATGSLKNPYKNVSRNDPCPCGSGKKFKKCHGMT